MLTSRNDLAPLRGALLACAFALFVSSARAQNIQNMRVGDLDISRVTTGWGQAQSDKSMDSKTLSIAGKTFAHGLGTHAPSAATIALDGRAQSFQASVGVDDEVAGQKGSVEFKVVGDGKELWKSGVMHAGDAAKPINVDIRGVKLLQLLVTDGGNGRDYDHADWGDARIEFSGTAPQMARDPREVWIEAGQTNIVFRVDDDKTLQQIRFGPTTTERSGKAYLPSGDESVLEPAVGTIHTDGNTSTQLEFVRQSQQNLDANVTQTRIELKDPKYPFFVTLVFKAYRAEDVIEQWSEIRHQENGTVVLNRFASAAPTLGTDDYYLTQFRGAWANEMNAEEGKLDYGVKTLESRRITQAQLGVSPSFLLSVGAPARETEGEVIGGSLAYSGSFQLQFEVDADHRLRALCGMNSQDVRYQLAPNETFVTPSMIWSWSNGGRGELGRNFARWGRKYGMRDGLKAHDVLLNNWEATFFNFNEDKLTSMFDGAKDLGMELFLLDDGWFGNKYPRSDDTQGLGDWQTTTTKLPHGISYLTDEAKKRGLRFGLWLEPEMVNPKSELFEKHPDWAIQLPNRELNLIRNQLVLDLSNPQVRDWVFQTVDGILTQNPGISYIKWDCNRLVNQPGSTYLPAARQSQLNIEYNRALYEVMDRLSKAHPNVQIMDCSSGGGRVDYGALRFGSEFWPSDNTDPLKRVSIQWGYEQFFPTNAIAAHVTRWGNRPLKFAFDVAMSARLGMDMDTAHLSAEDKAFAKAAIASYKTIRDVVQLGDLYRLESPYDGARASQMNISPDKTHAVVFAWQTRDGAASRLALQGLDAAKRYRVQEINMKAGQTSKIAENGQVLDGATLAKSGLTLPLQKQFDSAIIELRAQ
ncbi:alpha-galactosidase AgaA [Abditibacteriota bacterium]|nr:alpha-galactosidase AgaA [Abditibacteriota bacterium]